MKKPRAKPANDTAPARVAAVVPVAAKPPATKTKLPETTEALPWTSAHDIKKEPNAFTETDWYNRAYAWAGMAVRLVIVFGSLFSVYQFLVARSEKRVERTLGLVELWESPDYQVAQEAITRRLADLNAANQAFLPKSPTKTELAVYMARIGVQAMQPDPAVPESAVMQERFEKVVYFLNRMAFCVEGNICSDEIADAYFKDYAISFWDYFNGYVDERRRTGSATFAQPIENYVMSRTSGQ